MKSNGFATAALGALVLFSAGRLVAEPVGLVLSGGGAKGAYEVGVWKAMVEDGLARDVRVISGTSVGAINGALFASVRDPAKIEKLWIERIGMMLEPALDGIRSKVQGALDATANHLRDKETFVAREKQRRATELGISVEDLLPDEIETIERDAAVKFAFKAADTAVGVSSDLQKTNGQNSESYHRLLDDGLPVEWPADAPLMYVVAKEKERGVARTFLLNRETHPRRVEEIAASSAVPRLFAPVTIDGVEYVDGGVGWNKENTPIRPIVDNHPEVRTVVVVYLDNEERLNRAVGSRTNEYSQGKAIVEVIPSEDTQGMLGTIDTSAKRVRRLIELGYQDARMVLKKMGGEK